MTGQPRSFTRALVFHIAGLVFGLGFVLLATMVWQGVTNTEQATQREIDESLDRAMERLQILIGAAEMTVDSAARAARTVRVDGAKLRLVMEGSLSAFEQRPELSYLGIVLPQHGEYGTLERTGTGEILLWLFPGVRPEDRFTRNYTLTRSGFAPREEHPTDGYDARVRPFYRAASNVPATGGWIASYRWIIHFEGAGAEPLWGFSYVKALRDRSGALLGVLDADFDIPALNRFLTGVGADYGVRLQVVELGDTPRLVGDPQAGRAPLPVPSELMPVVESSASGGYVGPMLLDGERRWAAARHMELKGGLPWVVIASRQAPLIEAPLRSQLYQVAGMGAVTVPGLVLISVRLARRFGQPLAELESSVAAIGGPGTQALRSVTPAASTFRETQLLGEALGRMATAIRDREQELAARTAQLLQAKEQQVASLALKGAIFDSTSTAILSLDRDLAIVEWNAAAESLFGVEHGHAVGRAVRDLVQAPDGPPDWDEILATEGAGTFALLGIRGPFDAELRVIALHQAGQAIRTLVINDISTRKTVERQVRQERDYADAVLNSLPGVFYHCDQHSRLRRWNRNLERITGADASDLAGADPLVFFPEEERALVARMIAEVFDKGEAHFEASYLLSNGQRVPCLFTGLRFEHDGARGFVGVGTDISDRKQAELAAQESLARFDAVARATGEVVWNWDLESNTIWWNQNFETLFGYGAQEIEPTIESWTRRIHPDDHDRVTARIEAVIACKDDTWTGEYRFRRSDGSYADVFDRGCVLRDATGRGVRMVGAIQDITERKRAEQRLRYLATRDELTDLPNRNLLQDRLAQAIAHAGRTEHTLALLFIDLDRFKVVNDAYGHPFGDAVLKAAGQRLVALVREGDTVARHGGDEFMVLLTDLHTPADADAVARKITESLRQPLAVQGREIHLSGSVGMSVYPHDGDTAEALITHSDLAMYRAKSLGRNTYQAFTREMSVQTQERVHLETGLRGAADAGQLHLVYQPKVSLTSGTIIGCEALLRWKHPELGMVSPGRFIPIAEDAGLIAPLSDWVLRTACLQAKAWSDAGLPAVAVAVNISARQILQQDVAAWVLAALGETGLAPALLELELTESLIAQDVDKVIATFGRLKAAGVKLSIDDFGTGYSSLSYLKHFPVDALKIDQSFVRNMLTEPGDATIVRAVIALAHNLDFKVIAEGVETEEQCRLLRQHQCDEIQGYYFSKPVLASDFETMLRRGRRLPSRQVEAS